MIRALGACAIGLVLAGCRPRVATPVPSHDLESAESDALAYAARQLGATAESLDPANGYPQFTGRDGRWVLARPTAWTSGFFAGSLWQMYAETRDTVWRRRAERWSAGLAVNATRTDTHDLGFLIFPSFGLAYELTGDPHDLAVVDTAARSLATRFSDRVGAIKSWDTEGRPGARAAWRFPVIIDNMMNLEILFWAAEHGGEPRWREIAARHARTSARALVRADGSTAHVALFDPSTGALLRRVTWQGYADSSVWARGQAWAIDGFTQAYEATGDTLLLRTAERVANWYVSHLPADGVPYWDFDDPGIPNAPRDASAAAIASDGLLRLASISSISESTRFRTAAERTLLTLSTQYLTEGSPAASVLKHAVGELPQHAEVDVGIVYADYYFLRALRLDRAARGR